MQGEGTDMGKAWSMEAFDPLRLVGGYGCSIGGNVELLSVLV